MQRLKDKVAIVTGASSGIGAATALTFAREGACVMLAGRRRSALDALVKEIVGSGGRAAAVDGDVRDDDYMRALVEETVRLFGGLDVAFNNAGSTGELAPIASLSVEAWRETIDVNLTSAFLAARHQAPALVARGGGSLIFTSTFVGHSVGMPAMSAYAASKAGLLGLTRSLASELGPQGIRVNALLPGATDTPSLTARTEEQRAWVAGLHALRRIATPDEIARSALYLASDDSRFTTGLALLADGGISVTRT
ncbi:SDR family oxidoreductase [Vulgatibacter incomptus]|uniref:Oxidoreductase ucpA n=1 Tax=Vulgatibacter incomptus TaxID=1391653 RepID=A0A0K1PGQ5_9BACT|nr:SDR family oxidoreductase [Vulgatibacter incomptus]AKU92692.1 Oxidoreductase ucpA [Vulgatibacter incomptus]